MDNVFHQFVRGGFVFHCDRWESLQKRGMNGESAQQEIGCYKGRSSLHRLGYLQIQANRQCCDIQWEGECQSRHLHGWLRRARLYLCSRTTDFNSIQKGRKKIIVHIGK